MALFSSYLKFKFEFPSPATYAIFKVINYHVTYLAFHTRW